PAIVTGVQDDSPVFSASAAYMASSEVPASTLDRSPSRLGPLMVMLAFGVTTGLAAGYLAWSRPDPVAAQPQAVVPAEAPKPSARATPSTSSTPGRPRGREFTESAVPAPPKAPENPPVPPPTHAAPPAAPKSDATNATNPNPAAGRLLVR